MDRILVSFEYKGKHYEGYFSQPYGTGNRIWFLTIDGYHRGQLQNTDLFGWQFSNNKDEFLELTEFFADVIINWYQ